MKITEIENLTKYLLKQHLPKDYKNWKIEFYCSSVFAGRCFFYRNIIQYSLVSIENLPNAQMEEVIRHEVAHAVAFKKFKCNSHNYIWESVCKNILICPAKLYVEHTATEFNPDYFNYRMFSKGVSSSEVMQANASSLDNRDVKCYCNITKEL